MRSLCLQEDENQILDDGLKLDSHTLGSHMNLDHQAQRATVNLS